VSPWGRRQGKWWGVAIRVAAFVTTVAIVAICLHMLALQPCPKTTLVHTPMLAIGAVPPQQSGLSDSGFVELRGSAKYPLLKIGIDSQPQGVQIVIQEIEESGRLKRLHRLRADEQIDSAQSVTAAQWLDEDRIFVDCHVNPSLGVGLEIDLRSDAAEVYMGALFAWDSKGRKIAFAKDPPHFTPQGLGVTELWLGRVRVTTLPPRSVRRLWWNAAGDVLVAEVSHPKAPGDLLVLDYRENALGQSKWFVSAGKPDGRSAMNADNR